MTLSQLAKLAHVSVSTASKAFTMSKEVNEETRELIFSVARENGCFKKFFNAKYPKYMVAIICPEIKSYTYSSLCLKIQELLNEHNCEVCVSTSEFSSKNAYERLEYYDKYSCADAVVLIDIKTDTAESNEYIVPIVSVNSNIKNPTVSINNNLKEAMEEAVAYFCQHGITDIAYVGENMTGIKNEFFREIYEKITGKSDDSLIFLTEERFEKGGYSAANKILDSRNGSFPKAVICAYDYMAFGVIRFLNDNGIRVPEDVKIIGMDNISTADYSLPRLSSIDPMNSQTAEIVTESILGIFNGETQSKEYVFTRILVHRESSDCNTKNE